MVCTGPAAVQSDSLLAFQVHLHNNRTIQHDPHEKPPISNPPAAGLRFPLVPARAVSNRDCIDTIAALQIARAIN
jgi:hypothetical protein